MAVSTLCISIPAALGGAGQPAEETGLALGAAEEAPADQEYSFDILAPYLAPSPAAKAEPAPGPSALQEYDDHENGMFFRVGGGLITSQSSDGPDEEIDFDEGYSVSSALGYRFAGSPNNLGFDLELEGIWTDQDTDDDEGGLDSVEDVTVIGALVNGVADFRLAERFSIYGGLGVGAAMMDIGTQSDALNDFDDEDGPFLTWQGKAGVKFITGPGAFNLGYRFLNVDDVEIDDDVGDSEFDLETQQHGIELGYTFGTAATY